MYRFIQTKIAWTMKKNNQLLANPPIELIEYGDKKKIELTGPEAEIFNRKFSKYLNLTWESGGECFVRAKNCAGILALEEHIIKISPKKPSGVIIKIESWRELF